MKPIKTISGEMLLYFYLLQRQDLTKLKNTHVSFGFWKSSIGEAIESVRMNQREQTIFGVDDLQEYSDNDLYNALMYLSESCLIDFKSSPDSMGQNFLNFSVSAHGIDMIEGIERGEKEQENFNVTFNFNINNEVTVESLLKMKFGAMFKASVI